MDSSRRTSIHDAMVRLSDGDRTAFPMLVDELWPVLLSFARRGVRDEVDAEDIAQEVFYRICSRIADFDPSRDGLSWAFGIARFEIMTHRRRLQRRREVYDETLLPGVEHPALSQEELMLQRELAIAFESTLGALTDDDRRTLGLLEPVVTDGLGAATLRKRKQRALDRLRDLWRSLYGES
jgi:RNA polymerase sigma-70 factor, ECF subfamily